MLESENATEKSSEPLHQPFRNQTPSLARPDPQVMTSLADELMNDLDDLGSGSEPEQEGDEPVVVDRGHAADDSSTVNVKEEEDQDEEDDMTKMIGVVPEGGVKPADELDEDEVNRMEFGEVDSVESVARLYHGKTLKDVLHVEFQPTECRFAKRGRRGGAENRFMLEDRTLQS